MTRSYYDARPSKFEAVGNGSYIYRWDIQEEDAPQHQIAIRAMWDANYEQKLINEYNAANLGVYGGSKSSDEAKAKIASYKDFLAARATLKAQIDADCAELNIE